jgi:WD repeat-containing protein 23
MDWISNDDDGGVGGDESHDRRTRDTELNAYGGRPTTDNGRDRYGREEAGDNDDDGDDDGDEDYEDENAEDEEDEEDEDEDDPDYRDEPNEDEDGDEEFHGKAPCCSCLWRPSRDCFTETTNFHRCI